MNQQYHTKGAVVFMGHAQWSGDIRTCPVCDGATKVIIKPVGAADDKGAVMDCDYCINRHQGQPPRGRVIDQWSWHPFVQTIKIEGVETKDGPLGVEVKYLFNMSGGCYNSIEHKRVVATHAEAQAIAEAAARNATLKSQAELAQVAPAHNKSKSWYVGYHRAQIRDGTAKIEKLKNDLSNEERRLAYAKEQLHLTQTKQTTKA